MVGSHFTYKFNVVVCHFFNVCFFRNNLDTNMFHHVLVHVMGEICLMGFCLSVIHCLSCHCGNEMNRALGHLCAHIG